MAAALVTLLILSWGGLALVTVFGYLGAWHLVEPVRHIHLAIPAFIFGTLAHAMGMFYFIGTGKVIKEAVAENEFDPEWARETILFKKLAFPWATYAMIFIMATSILGGAVDTGRLPAWFHGLLGVATLLVAGRATWVQVMCISRNLQLMDRLEEALLHRPAAEESAAETTR